MFAYRVLFGILIIAYYFCNYNKKVRKKMCSNLVALYCCFTTARPWIKAFKYGKSRSFYGFPLRGGSAVGGGEV